MSKILSDEMYKQAGDEIDKKLKHMQDIIIEQARKKAMGKIIVEQRDDWSWICPHCKKTNKYIYEYEEGCSGQGNLTCQFCNEDTWDPPIDIK